MAGWNDAQELVVAGTGEAYVGPVGTTEPTTAESSLNAALIGLGYHTEEGVSTNKALEITEHRVWQKKVAVRRDKESEDFTITFQLVQWNETTLPFALGGGEVVSVGSGQWRYSPPDVEDALEERMLVVDVVDGDTKGRFVIPRGNVTEGVESSFRSNELSVLPVTFKALVNDAGDDWYFLTNDDDAFAAGS